jgi:hypothetical protein
MSIKPSVAAEIAYWTARIAELERQIDAATKLSEVRAIAGELMRTRAALERAKAQRGSARQPSKHKTSRQNGRRSASSAAEPQARKCQLRAVALAQRCEVQLAAVWRQTLQ